MITMWHMYIPIFVMPSILNIPSGSIEHQWKRGDSNDMKTEHMWWRFRHMCVPESEKLLEKGDTN
jgi:hypothetical protein